VPPLIGFAIAYALVEAGIIAAEAMMIVATVISVALSVAMQFAIQAASPKPKSALAGMNALGVLANEARGRTLLVRSSTEPHRFIYGRALVSGPLLFAATSGTDNSTLHIVVGIAGHECEEIIAVYFGDELSDNARIRNYCTYTAHLGNQTAVDPDLLAVSGIQSTDLYLGITYLYCELLYDQNIWLAGLPNVRGIVKGKKVWDPRTDTTAWSDNAALCQLDYLMGDYGIGASVDAIDLPSWIAAANICDEQVALASGDVQKRYLCNGTFTRDQRPIDVMEDLLSASAGTIIYSQGKYYGYAATYDVPTHSLTEDDLRGELTLATKPARRDLFNTVRGVFVDPIYYWQPTDFPYVTDGTFVTDDGEVLTADIQLPYTVESASAQRLAKIHLLRHRRSLTINFPAKLTALRIMPWDTVTLTSPTLGYESKTFRVLSASLTNDLGVDLVLKEEDADVYAWDAEETSLASSEADLPNPWIVQDLTGFWLRSGVDVNQGTNYRIWCQWFAHPDATVQSGGYIEIDYRLSGTTEWISGLSVSGTSIQGYLSALALNTAYDVRARAVNSLGVSSRWVGYTGHIVRDGIISASMCIWVTKAPSITSMTATEV
jgi:hypothetical protein